MTSLVSEPNMYNPEWDIESATFIDSCPFEPNRSGTLHICRCRNQRDTFKNMTEFKIHTKNKYHKQWLLAYGIHTNKEIETLTEELKRIEKINAILHASLEKYIARSERYKLKYETLKKENYVN